MRFFGTCLLVFATATGAFAATATPTATPTLKLNVLSEADFCHRMTSAFSTLAASFGHDKARARLIGSRASSMIGAALTSNQVEAFVNPAAFELVPTNADDKQYMSTAQILAATIGVEGPALLLRDVTELRYLPYAQKSVEVIVVTARSDQLTADRIAAVAAYATRERVRISVVWTGSDRSPSMVSEARNLAWLAAKTGGVFADIGRSGRACAESVSL